MVNSLTRKNRAKVQGGSRPKKAELPSNRGQQAAGRSSRREGSTQKKMLIYDVRSRNVYENYRNTVIMTGEKSDIYVNLTRILHKTPAL